VYAYNSDCSLHTKYKSAANPHHHVFCKIDGRSACSDTHLHNACITAAYILIAVQYKSKSIVQSEFSLKKTSHLTTGSWRARVVPARRARVVRTWSCMFAHEVTGQKIREEVR
jgi:predicted secreted protein